MTVRVGVVGAGSFGRAHALAYARLADAELVSIVDADPARAASLAAELDVVTGEPDAVSIVVPARLRGSLVADSIAAGRAVLIEKPLATTAAEASELAARGRGAPVMVGHVLRFAEPYVRLEATARGFGVLAGGSLGRLRSAEHAVRHPGDDVIGLTMIHDLDAAAWLAASPLGAVAASGRRGPDGRWLAVDAELVTLDGSRWFVHARWEGRDIEQADDASITAADGRSAAILIEAADADVYDRALDAELAHFVEHAAARTPSTRLDLDDAARAVAAADAVRVSLDQNGALVDVR